MGLQDKRIAVIGENRYEWGISYLATCCGTGVVVPLDKALPPNEIEELIMRSGAECIFYTEKYDEVMQEIRSKDTTSLKYFISMDLKESTTEVYSMSKLIEEGKKLLEYGDKRFIDAVIDAEKMTFMLFTSGTTSQSKTVMLSHKNICADLTGINAIIKIYPTDVFLSFLPIHHTFECTVGFLLPIYKGACVTYCDGVKHIADNMKEFGVTAMISVPALYEGMYKKVMKSIEKQGKTKKVETGIKISSFLLKLGIDVRKKLFKDIHGALGGNARLFVSGAAGLDPKVEVGFNQLGFKLFQGYGLTETSPVISAGSDKHSRVGSVGRPMYGVEMKIDAPDSDGVGEIIAKGNVVMLGYYQNEEATKEVLKDGWFHTGDLGYIDKDGYVFITGRKKSVIVLENGKNIFPEEIESVINRIEGVKESFVYGRPDKKDLKICAKIVYAEDIIEEKYGKKTEEEIKAILWEEIKIANKTMPAYKYVKEIIITTEELIKTTTQKVKRHEELKKILDK